MPDKLTNATTGTISVSQGSVITLQTAGTYMPSNIELTMNVATANPAFDGGGLTDKTASATFTNITTSDTDNGISILTKGTAGRAAVLYNGAVNGWVSKADNDTASAAVSASTWNGTTYYVTGVTVPVDKPFSVTTNADTAEDTSSDITITNATNRRVVVTTAGHTIVNAASNTEGYIEVAAYEDSNDTTLGEVRHIASQGVWNTYNRNPSTAVLGPFYGKTTIAAVSQTNLTAANIKYGTTVLVKGGTSTIYSVAGTFTSDGNITAADVATGKIAYSQGQQIVGEMPSNGTLTGTITTQNGTFTIPAGHTSGGTVTATFPETNVSTPTWTKNSSTKIVTFGDATWGTGYITSNDMDAATFANSGTSGVTYLDLSDGKKDSSNMVIPEIPSGGKLYINRGYIDNVCIDLSRLIPDAAAVNGLAATHILSGHSAYDNAGNLIVGSISSKAAATYYPSTSDQTIAAEQYLSGVQTIKAVTTTNLSAANVKYGVTIQVGDSADSDRVATATGTFTATPAGKTALTAAALRSGYSGFINGAQVDGTMPDISVTTGISNSGLSTYFNEGSSSSNSITLTPTYTNTTAGYLAAHSTAQNGTAQYYTIKTATFTGNGGNVTLVADTTSNSIYQSSSNTGNVSIESSAPTANSGYLYIKVTGSGTAKASAAGWIEAEGATATGSTTKYIKLLKYDGSYTVT